MTFSDLPNPGDQIQKIGQGLSALHDRLIAAGADGLYEAGNIIITDAQENYVPVRDGILRASGHVDPPVILGNDAYVVIGFGGAAEAYALEQHERLDFQHTIGGPKYLERPVLAHAALGTVQSAIGLRMQNVFTGGGA